MLYLTRKPGDSIVINDNVEITVISVSGKAVKLGFVFPPDVVVLRKEVYDRIQAENRAAAENTPDLTRLTLPQTLPPPPSAPSPPDPTGKDEEEA